jgi:hypothetical protein
MGRSEHRYKYLIREKQLNTCLTPFISLSLFQIILITGAMAKKILLKSRSEPAFYTLIGISCHLMDYRLLHLINKELGFNFTKEDDFKINVTSKKQVTSFSLYSWKDEDQRNSYYLIANFSQDIVLIPEFKHTDFVMLIEGDFKKQRIDTLLKAIRSVPKVITAFEIKVSDLKNPETFLTDLEIHVTEIRKECKKNSKSIN